MTYIDELDRYSQEIHYTGCAKMNFVRHYINHVLTYLLTYLV